MVHRILVPLDGSPLSEQAVPYAQALATAAKADLIFMRAVLTAGQAGGAASFNQSLREEGRQYLDAHQVAARRAGLHAEGHVWEDEAGYSIRQMVEIHRPDLVVMSTHGRSGLGRVVWGSVADYVLHHTTVPILMIPRGVEGGWTNMSRPRFVVPLDGSSLAEEALPIAEELARAFTGEIVLVEAAEPSAWLQGTDPWAAYSADFSLYELGLEQTEAAGRYLDSVANTLNQKGITASVTVQNDRAASAIRQAVRDHQARAIVMATHGRGGTTRLLMGSVTDAVVRSARVPVLVVRPVEARPESRAEEPVVREEQRNLVVSLTYPELELTRAALQQLVNNSHGEGQLVQVFDLLDRLNQVHGAKRPAVGAGR